LHKDDATMVMVAQFTLQPQHTDNPQNIYEGVYKCTLKLQ